MKTALNLVAIAISSLSLVACGGGGGGGGNPPPPPPPPPPPSNHEPIARAGNDFNGSLKASGIELDGSASSDADGDPLTYSWAIVSQPTGSSATLTDADTAKPTLVALAPGRYVLELSLGDGKGGASKDRVTLTLVNDAPEIALDTVQNNIAIGFPLNLDATGSNDPNGHSLLFNWTLTSAPGSSNLKSQFEGPAPDIELDVEGDFTFRLDVSDGYETTSQSITISAALFDQNALQHSFDFAASDVNGSILVTAFGADVRILDEQGQTSHAFALPENIVGLSVSPNGQWIGIAHLNKISIINITNHQVMGTWDSSVAPGDIIISNQGYLHAYPEYGSWVNVHTFNPNTGAESLSSRTFFNGSHVAMHPDGLKAYAAHNGVSPADIERFNLENEILQGAYDSPYHGDYSFCGDLWIDNSGHSILTKCGVILHSSDDRATDMTYKTTLALTGTVVAAAYQDLSDKWYVVEQNAGDYELNVYDGSGGTRLETLELPEIRSGRQATPLQVFAGLSSETVQVLASDHPTNPLSYALLELAMVDEDILDYPPVSVVSKNLAGFVRDTVTLDASGSYDPEGKALSFSWSLVSQPANSDIMLNNADEAIASFIPYFEGEYVLSLVTSDGLRSAAAQQVHVRIVPQGAIRQVRLEGTPSDFVYNKAAHQLLYTFADRNELRIRNLDDFSEWVVPLSRPGLAVDVSPNGQYGVVSHKGLASLIELRADGASVIDTQVVSADWGDIVVDNNQIAYQIPIRDQWVELLAIDFAGDRVTQDWGAYAGSQLRMLPAGGAVYAANRGLYPSDIFRYRVSDLNNITHRDSPYHGHYAMNGNLWISESSDRLLVAGGNVFRASDIRSQDMVYVETLSPAATPLWADHSQEAGRWLVVDGNKVKLYNDATYLQAGSVDIDPLFIDAQGDLPRVDQAYYSDDASEIVVIAHSERLTVDKYIVQIIQ